MKNASNNMTLAAPNRTARWAQWAAYGACAWAFLFAALSFYWALGGMVGVDTAVSPAIALCCFSL